MSQAKHLSTRRSNDNGSFQARRTIIRWAWRMFRREWHQQLLVLILLTVAITTAIFTSIATYNIAPVAGNAEFGSANSLIRLNSSDPQVLASDIADAHAIFGEIDVIRHRAVLMPGSVDTLDFRDQDPQGSFSGPMLALYEGHFPNHTDEVAITDGVAESFGLRLGDSFALDGNPRVVVGIVENPSDLNDEFALVAPATNNPPDEATILLTSSDDEFSAFRPHGSLEIGTRPSNEGVLAAVTVLGIATVALLLIALVSAASFIVLAQRRLRQLGMLAAIGATEKHLQLVIMANGAIIGIIAAVVGVTIGVITWIVAIPPLEPAFGHRIALFNVPWWLIGACIVLAVLSATGAAWWPARTVAHIPITQALSGRPPRPKPAYQSIGLALILLIVGIACLIFANQTRYVLIIIGIGATVVGMLLISPVALQLTAAAASRFPVSVRLAVRDLARYQGRSGTALAAISLALGIAATIVIVVSAGQDNLSDSQLLIWTRNPNDPEGVSPFYTEDPNDSGFSPFIPDWTPTEVENLEMQVDRIADLFENPTVTALDVAIDPAAPPDPLFDGRQAITLAKLFSEGGRQGWQDVTLLYIATPVLLDMYGVDLSEVDSDVEILTVETDALRFIGMAFNPNSERFNPETVQNAQQLEHRYLSFPGSFIRPQALRERGWEPRRVGWLVQTDKPLTAEQLADARQIALEANMLIESRYQNEGLLALRWQATIAGILVSLTVLSLTVGLIRSEAVGDIRILTATGATSRIRRSLTAATAGTLAFLGALIGIVAAFLGLIAGYSTNILTPTSLLFLGMMTLGVTLVAIIGGWLLAGREPPMLARQPIE